MVILMILSLPVQECRHIFPSVCHFQFLFLQFWEYKSFVSLGRFIARYFILFDAIVNEIVSLISLSNILLLVYRNATDMYFNFLFSNFSLMGSSSFLVASLGFSLYSIFSHLQTVTVLLLPFQLKFLLFLFSDCC